MDFYTRDVPHYYPTRFVKSWGIGTPGDPRPEPESDVTYVDVVADAPADNQPSETDTATEWKHVVTIPPYARPLTSAADPRAWWAEHRPLVLQSEALGPFKNAEANLAGFRVLTVKNDVIERVHHVSIETLHASDYQIEWETLT